MQWRDGLRPLSMLERNELLDTQGASESVKEFLIRYSIDQSAAFALLSLPLEQQNEVTRQITGATNPSAVLLSRIKRVKQGQPALNRVATVASEANTSPPPPPPPPPPDETRAAVEAFLEKHCINSDACQSLWELSPVQQLQVISTELTPTSTDAAYDALMDRVSEILQGGDRAGKWNSTCSVGEFSCRVPVFHLIFCFRKKLTIPKAFCPGLKIIEALYFLQKGSFSFLSIGIGQL